MSVRPARDHDERDPREDEADAEKTAGDVFSAAGADPGPENARDQETEKRQEDDQLVHETVSALQRVYVLNRDRAAITVIGNQDRESDRRLSRGDSEDEERKRLTRQIARIG